MTTSSHFDIDMGISAFVGKLDILDPYTLIPIELPDHRFYPSLMHAYIAARTEMPDIRDRIRTVRDRRILEHYNNQLIPSSKTWHMDRRSLIRDLLEQKFTRSREIANRLLDTHPYVLYYISSDLFLGCASDGKAGENYLGFTMMAVRSRLRRKQISVKGCEVLSLPAATPKIPEDVGVLLKEPTLSVTGQLRLIYPDYSEGIGYL